MPTSGSSDRSPRQRKRTVIPLPAATAQRPAISTNISIKARHLIENFFCKLKQFRAIATRYDKRARNFLAGIYLAATVNLA